MIFGKTKDQQEKIQSQQAKEKIFGKKKFAFLPVELVDGRFIWLSFYYVYHNGHYDILTKKFSLVNEDSDGYVRLERNMEYVCLYDRHSWKRITDLDSYIKDRLGE